jgi:hypothetical protein
VTVSTAEAEYVAAATAVCEELWLRQLLTALDIEAPTLPLLSDSQAAIAMTKHPGVSARTKHMDVRLHFVRKRETRGGVSLSYTRTDEMLADPLTKAVNQAKMNKMRDAWGLR